MQVEELPRCVRHPRVKTAISCAECGDPICPDCMVQGPVGIKCPNCARLPRSARPHLKPDKAAAAVGTAIGLGVVIGFAQASIAGTIGGFFSLIVAYGVGWFMAAAVKRAAGYYPGAATGWIAAGGALLAYVSPFGIAPGLFGTNYSQPAMGFEVVIGLFAAFIAYRQTA
jgi:hypothetical protein